LGRHICGADYLERLPVFTPARRNLTMEWINYVSYFFGDAFLTNAIPHFVSGTMGRRPHRDRFVLMRIASIVS
jgi:hypothetical protein